MTTRQKATVHCILQDERQAEALYCIAMVNRSTLVLLLQTNV